MKKYIKETVILLIQLAMFYISPLFAGPTDAMGMISLIVLATLVLSFAVGTMSHNKVKYLYPVVTTMAFIPSVFLYYNASAMIHSVWYFVVSCVGLLVGTAIQKLISLHLLRGEKK